MAAHVVTVTTAASPGNPPLVKGQTVHLTAAQETALAADIRAVTARDQCGESFGVSN